MSTTNRWSSLAELWQVVAKLVHVRDATAAMALEVTAGGRLYQVVVDNHATGKALLERGGLTKRVTIIPLNQVGEAGRLVEEDSATAAGFRCMFSVILM
jgi:chromosome segregation ATPase